MGLKDSLLVMASTSVKLVQNDRKRGLVLTEYTERIATMFFAQKCEEFGVQQPFGNAISVCKKIAFDIQEKTHKKTADINCPICNGTLTIDESVLDIGECGCPHCGSILEFRDME